MKRQALGIIDVHGLLYAVNRDSPGRWCASGGCVAETLVARECLTAAKDAGSHDH